MTDELKGFEPVAWVPKFSWQRSIDATACKSKRSFDDIPLYTADQLAAVVRQRDELQKDAERYRWILHQAKITDFIFEYTKSDERHVSNAIDAATRRAIVRAAAEIGKEMP